MPDFGFTAYGWHSAAVGRNQDETLRVLRASQPLTQGKRGISVSSVLRFFWPRSTQRFYTREEKSSRQDTKTKTSSTTRPIAATKHVL